MKMVQGRTYVSEIQWQRMICMIAPNLICMRMVMDTTQQLPLFSLKQAGKVLGFCYLLALAFYLMGLFQVYLVFEILSATKIEILSATTVLLSSS